MCISSQEAICCIDFRASGVLLERRQRRTVVTAVPPCSSARFADVPAKLCSAHKASGGWAGGGLAEPEITF
jgi:hypothetical protein